MAVQDSHSPSETSPLLGSSNGSSNGQTSATKVQNIISSGIAEANGPQDVETQFIGDAAREAQYNGHPEVKQQLKYIIPAVSVGVCVLIPRSLVD